MKRLLYLLLLIPAFSFSQLKISDMPTYMGNPNGNFVPVVIANTNRKVDAAYFGYNKVDSISIGTGTTYDTLWVWKFGTKSFFKLVRGGGSFTLTTTGSSGPATFSGGVLNIPQYTGGSGGTVTSVSMTVPSGLSVSISNTTTTPAINLTTSLTGVLLGTGTGFSALTYGANGTYLKMVSGSPAFVNDSALIPTDNTLNYSTGVLGINTAGTGPAIYKSVTVTSSSYTVAAGIYTVFCNYTGGTCTITLPTTFASDTRVTIQNISTNNVSVTSTVSPIINLLTQNDAFTYQWTGSVWILVGK